MRKKVFLAGSVLVLMLILGSGLASAEASHSSPYHHGHHGLFLEEIASKLNLSSEDIDAIKSEIRSGLSIRDVLANHGITMSDIRTALGTITNDHRLSNTQIQTLANKMGLDADEIQNEIDSGKSLHEIMRSHDITPEKVHATFGSRIGKAFNHFKNKFN